jgi:hypothetical protein
VPDISMSAAVDGAALVCLDAKPGFNGAGCYLIGGCRASAAGERVPHWPPFGVPSKK